MKDNSCYSILKMKNNNPRRSPDHQTLVCVKKVKQEASEIWNWNMPLPGDIVEGVAKDEGGEEEELMFIGAKCKSELSSLLGKMNREAAAAVYVWLKVRRGESTRLLPVRIVPERYAKLHRRFTVRAVSDARHVAVLADMTFDQCTQLQEMSRRMVNEESTRGFNRKGIRYNWNKKVDAFLPDRRCTVVSSILFMPLAAEHDDIEATTVRTMAWFPAAVSHGIPLVFVNIQTEQVISNQGFICIYAMTKGTTADRCGLGETYEEARKAGHQVVISRLQGKSLLPSKVCCQGLIQCCENADIKETLLTVSAMDNQVYSITIHVMSWPTHKPPPPHSLPSTGVAASIRPPN